jgi:tRNA(fMet)-specific endonuclease VapC
LNETLLDTDILSFYFKGDHQVVKNFTEYLEQYDSVNLSIITYFEITSGLKFKQAKKQLHQFEQFVSFNNVIHITLETTNIASDIYATIRKKGITIGLSDLIIAAIAIENDLVLVSNNVKHFEAIKNLKIVNWKK